MLTDLYPPNEVTVRTRESVLPSIFFLNLRRSQFVYTCLELEDELVLSSVWIGFLNSSIF